MVIGPGIGVSGASKKMLQELLKNSTVPVIIDADGLNVLAEDMSMLKKAKCPIILTPHMKEMSRLVKKDISEVLDCRFEIAKKLSEDYHVICVLKDAKSIIPDNKGKFYINEPGNSGMSTGGSGDVLTGIIAAFIAGGLDPLEAARLGAYVHGLAGDVAKESRGEYGLLASDIIEAIPSVLL